MGLFKYIPNEIAIFHRGNDQQNHWVQWGTQHFQTHPFQETLAVAAFLWHLACVGSNAMRLDLGELGEPMGINKQQEPKPPTN